VSAKDAKDKQEAIQQAARRVAEGALRDKLLEKSRLRKAAAPSTAPGAGQGSPKGGPGVPKPGAGSPGRIYTVPHYPPDPYGIYGSPRQNTCAHPKSQQRTVMQRGYGYVDFEVHCKDCGKQYRTRVADHRLTDPHVFTAVEQGAYRAGHRAMTEDGLKNCPPVDLYPPPDPMTYLPGHIGGR
jgi:hypothetical protein